MSIFLKKDFSTIGQVGIWKIEEDEDFFFRQLPIHIVDQPSFQKKHHKRRLEWLASRYLVHEMSNGDICKNDDLGKPFLENSNAQISISHSGEFAAVVYHPETIVGVDIQKKAPKIKRIAHKFMREEEKQSLQEHSALEHLHIYWGAKEALYKAYGRKELDFRQHIKVHPFSFSQHGGQTLGIVSKGDYYAEFDVIYECIDDYFLVYVVER